MVEQSVNETEQTQRFLRTREVMERIGISRATLYRWQRTGHFPQSRKLSEYSVGWLNSEIEDWIRTRPTGLGRHEPGN